MTTLFSELRLKGKIIKNRLVLPPMVTPHYTGADGIVTPRSIDHYTQRAANGSGMMIVEATAVQEDGRLALYQFGLWDDKFIPGLREIANLIKAAGSLALIQLHHAGLVSPEAVAPYCKGPTADPANPRSQALYAEEISGIQEAFISAALRARKAGFDGVELHGAHGYLLNQFASSYFNKRTDEYGGSIAGNLKLATDIIYGIRKKTGEDFIIGYRMGANSPLLEDGIAIAKHLEPAGIDLLHVSHGGLLLNLPRPPKEFAYNWIVYCGTVIKPEVSVPVIVVNEIKTAERASWLIEHGHADLVAIGRPMLADPQWTKHVQDNQPINVCSSCKPRCRWYQSSELCPAIIRLSSQNQKQ